ncbi:hypothetical protein ZHAS_00019883 [Anopheles sinensis]|uniref:Uncharacterized protein n=1 Tax=Anopheles sinensis TaxID=74873 RepID=A0A084WMG2_ANOSI|nr:hypothetical protein ZHAS_00019883 [Anopheles sinensis]
MLFELVGVPSGKPEPISTRRRTFQGREVGKIEGGESRSFRGCRHLLHEWIEVRRFRNLVGGSVDLALLATHSTSHTRTYAVALWQPLSARIYTHTHTHLDVHYPTATHTSFSRQNEGLRDGGQAKHEHLSERK